MGVDFGVHVRIGKQAPKMKGSNLVLTDVSLPMLSVKMFTVTISS